MDGTMKILLLTLIILSLFTAGPLFSGWWEERTYRDSLETGLAYRLVIASDRPLTNTTLFLPLPVKGNITLPSIEAHGTGVLVRDGCSGEMDLFSSGDALFLKLVIRGSGGPTMTSDQRFAYRCAFESMDEPGSALDVEDPERDSYIFRPRTQVLLSECPPAQGSPPPKECYQYTSLIYVDRELPAYMAIDAMIEGTNRWYIFEESSNGYRDHISLTLPPEMNGWFPAEGLLEVAIGDENPYYRIETDEGGGEVSAIALELRKILLLQKESVPN